MSFLLRNLCIVEGIYHCLHTFRIIDPTTESEEIGIIMLPCHSCRKGVLRKGTSDAVDLIGGNRDAYTCTAGDDTVIVAALQKGITRFFRHIRVVDGIGAEYPQVVNLISLFSIWAMIRFFNSKAP